MNKDTLIVIDMQNDFITGSLKNPDAEAIVPKIVDYINHFDGEDVILTQDTHQEDYLETPEGKKLPIPHCIEMSDGWRVESNIVDAVCAKQKTMIFVRKETFGCIDLTDVIPNEGKIILCGTCTDICVVSNALILRAQYPEREIIVLKDLCAGTTKENHEAALTVMKSCQIDVL